jgi:hypothetical protein
MASARQSRGAGSTPGIALVGLEPSMLSTVGLALCVIALPYSMYSAYVTFGRVLACGRACDAVVLSLV